MFKFDKKQVVLSIVCVIFMHAITLAQIINKDIEAKIRTEKNDGFITIVGTAFNKTEITESLVYKLSVIKKDSLGNSSKNDQEGRFVIQANQKLDLSSTVINSPKHTKTTLLLLIYNLDKKLIGKDRIVLNDDGSDQAFKKKILSDINLKTNPKATQQTVDVSSTKEDGVEIKGLVLEETKTKPGRDFYKLFYNLYTVNNINANKIVKIKEVLALGRNSKIEVLVGEKKVFEFFVRPSIDYLTKVNDQAILRVYKYLKNLEESADIQQRY